MYVKLYETKKDLLLAACDEELLGKELDGFSVSKRFYGGELTNEEAFSKMLDQCTVANLVGERVINTAKEKSLVGEGGIIMLSGVPHAQIVRML